MAIKITPGKEYRDLVRRSEMESRELIAFSKGYNQCRDDFDGTPDGVTPPLMFVDLSVCDRLLVEFELGI